jgi:hypothetical protein
MKQWSIRLFFALVWNFIRTTFRALFAPPRLVLPAPEPPEPAEEPVVRNVALPKPPRLHVHNATQEGAFGGKRKDNGIRWREQIGRYQ